MRRVFAILRRYRTATACLAVLVVVLGVKGWKRLTEPRYGGKGVREWIEQLPYDSRSRSEPNVAIDHFGLRAMPYLIEALVRPYPWEERLAQKLPGAFANVLPDRNHLNRVRYGALRKLGQMGADEREKNEWIEGAEYPIADAVLPVLARQLETFSPNARNLMDAIEQFGPRATNIAPQVKAFYRKGPPSGRLSSWHPYVRGIILMGTFRDATLTPEFVQLFNATSNTEVRMAAVEAIGQTGFVDGSVEVALTAGLENDSDLLNSCVLACVRLGICAPRVVEFSRRRTWSGNITSHHMILRLVVPWRCNTNDVEAAEAIIQALKIERAELRGALIELLGSAGPLARPFTPTLVQMLDEPAYRNLAAQALRLIDPVIAEREIRKRMRVAEKTDRSG